MGLIVLEARLLEYVVDKPPKMEARKEYRSTDPAHKSVSIEHNLEKWKPLKQNTTCRVRKNKSVAHRRRIGDIPSEESYA